MPQRKLPVDRKRELAEAVLSITTRRGLDAVSMRDVAAEANVSLGMVQHHFNTKDQMLLFACRYMVERNAERTRERMRAAPDQSSVRAILRATFERMLPLDDGRRAELRVWLAFLARAVVEPSLETFMRQTYAASHAFVVEQLRRAQHSGELANSRDPERVTIPLYGLVEGLVSQVQVGHYTGEQAMQAIDDQLEVLFGATGGGEAGPPDTLVPGSSNTQPAPD